MDALLVLLVLPASGMAAFAVAKWILRPLDRTAKSAHGAPQLSVIDLFWIFFAIQLAMAFVRSSPLLFPPFFVPVLDGFVWVACGLMWWFSARTLSRAGITRPWHRTLFLAFVMPAALAGAIGIPGAAFIAAMKLWDQTLFVFLELWQLAAIELGLLAGAYFSGRLTRRMVKGLAAPENADAPQTAGEMEPARTG